MVEPNMKTCSRCKTEKSPESDFYAYSNGLLYGRCKDCVKKQNGSRVCSKRKIVGTRAWFTRRYCSVKQHSKPRGKDFSLTLDEFIMIYNEWKCYYCGAEENLSIDRVDNDKGYVRGNCVLACLPCNKQKYNNTSEGLERMIIIAQKALAHLAY